MDEEEGITYYNNEEATTDRNNYPSTSRTASTEILEVPVEQDNEFEKSQTETAKFEVPEKKETFKKYLCGFQNFFKAKTNKNGKPAAVEHLENRSQPPTSNVNHPVNTTNEFQRRDQEREDNQIFRDHGFHDLFSSRRNLAQGMMDLALLTANASQLRYVLQTNQSQTRNASNKGYYELSLALISISIFLQVVVGILLIIIKRYTSQENATKLCQFLNDATVFIMFMILVVNIFIAAFGVNN